MAPALCVTFMVHGGLLCAANVQGKIRDEVMNIWERFLLEKITKTEVRTKQTPVHRTHTHTHTHTPSQKTASSTPIVHALQLIAELVQAAGRPACRIALRAMQPQIDYVLHGNPLAEPHDYDDPTMVHLTTMTRAGTDARYCLTADDLRKMDDGRAAEWAAAQSPVKVAPTCMYMHLSPLAPRPRPDTLALSRIPFASHPGSFRPLHRSAAHKRYRHKH